LKYEAVKKVVGGKLLRVKIEADEKINAVNITGDFFLHPEEALPAIEKSLAGSPIFSTASQLAETIHTALAEQNASFIGVSAEDIAETILEALKQTQ